MVRLLGGRGATHGAAVEVTADGWQVTRVTCGCGERVLLVRLAGNLILVDADEVVPVQPCPLCRAIKTRGQQPGSWCYRCGGTQVIGEPLPVPAVGILDTGQALPFDGGRVVGEAVHRLHLHAIG